MARGPGFHLYLVRHGESANNALPDTQRVPDPALTELGQTQARKLALHYANLDRIDHVLVSPFRRTLQTAQPLLETLGKRSSIWSGIYEVGGCYSGYEPGKLSAEPGMTAEAIGKEFPETDIPPDIDENGWYKSNVYETWNMAIPRAAEQAKKLRSTFADKDNVVFCFIHADFKQLLLQHLLPAQTKYHGGGITNSSVTHIHFDAETDTVKEYCNTDHLQENEISY